MDDNKQLYTIILRHDTSTQWAVNNPILTLGEYAVEDDTHRVKRGDGETEWNELPYEEFGLVYLVTYANLSGDVKDNEQLQNAFNEKMSLNVFEDVNYQTVSSITVEAESGAIGKITKVSKDINTNSTTSNMLLIKSNDNSVQGYWSIDSEGIKILNLIAESTITDYEVGHTYYKDHLCYYKNRLYRAVENFEAEQIFNPVHWVVLASKHAEDIGYDNLTSELDSDTVQTAIDELKRRVDTKVTKTTEHKVVYGTSVTGAQTVIPIDDLRTVDTVNGISATDQESKNIQIDATDINYNDDTPDVGTIKDVLDSKVDKTFAGEGAKIVRDVRLNYNSDTGNIEVIEDKVSPEDGTSSIETTEIDVVSETELLDTKADIEEEINAEVDILNERIDEEVETLNTTINTKEQNLKTQIDNTNTELERVEAESKSRDNDLNTGINNAVNTLNNTIQHQVEIIDGRINTEVATLNERVTSEVSTLNQTINSKEDRLENIIADNKSDIENKLSTGLDTKIDKDIADNIVTGLEVSAHDRQPTIKVTNKNTRSKQATYDYIHFGTDGKIKTRMEDEDHLIIDSTDIDQDITDINSHLDTVDSRLDAHDTNISALQEHDVNHDRQLASHANQIANHETRLSQAEDDIVNLDTKIEGEITNRTTADANLSARIADNAVRIAQNTQGIRDNADSIDRLAQTLEENVEALTNSKVDKEFASETDNKVVGKLESDEISGTEVFNLKETLVSPIDGTSTTERIKVVSSDGTIIATRNSNGTIDLAANLDTDVNYFVTTEIISTTIADETTLDMAQLTPTDKVEVEVQDIISDPEGTWGRVKSIDTTNNTCVVVTFKKHAQAVWGTIKGDVLDQLDLQQQFNDLENRVTNQINSEANARVSADSKLNNNINAEAATRERYDVALNNTKLGKVNTPNIVYGTDETGAQTTYDKNSFGKVDTVNNVLPNSNKNVELHSGNIPFENYTNKNTTQILNDLYDGIINLINSTANKVTTYQQGMYYRTLIDVSIPLLTGSGYTTFDLGNRYLTYTGDNGVILMAKVVEDFTSDATQSTLLNSFKHDVEAGHLQIMGIPEQIIDEQPAEVIVNVYDTNGNPINVTNVINNVYATNVATGQNVGYDRITDNQIFWTNLTRGTNYNIVIDLTDYQLYTTTITTTDSYNTFSVNISSENNWNFINTYIVAQNNNDYASVNVYSRTVDEGQLQTKLNIDCTAPSNSTLTIQNNNTRNWFINDDMEDAFDNTTLTNGNNVDIYSDDVVYHEIDASTIPNMFNMSWESSQTTHTVHVNVLDQQNNPISLDNYSYFAVLVNVNTATVYNATGHTISTLSFENIPTETYSLHIDLNSPNYQPSTSQLDVDSDINISINIYDNTSTTGSVALHLLDNNGTGINPSELTGLSATLESATGSTYSYGDIGEADWSIGFSNIPYGSYRVTFECNEYAYATPDTYDITVNTEYTSYDITLQSKQSEPEQTYDILNEVLGDSDEYTGMGGTEEEVEEIFDEILGNQ